MSRQSSGNVAGGQRGRKQSNASQGGRPTRASSASVASHGGGGRQPRPSQHSASADYQKFSGEYWGSVHIEDEAAVSCAEKIRRIVAAETVETSEGRITVGPGRRFSTIRIRGNFIKAVDEVTKDVLHVFQADKLVTIETNDADSLLVYTIKSADSRVSVQIAHAVKVGNPADVARALKRARKTALQAAKGAAAGADDQEETQSFSAFYLGFHRVAKTKGTTVVTKALAENMEMRAAHTFRRISRNSPKACTLVGASDTSEAEGSCVVEQHPIVLALTSRSLRIVDVVGGDTIQKFHIHQVTFSGALNIPGEPETFAAIIHNERLKLSDCHLFHVGQGSGAAVHKAISAKHKQAAEKFAKAKKPAGKKANSAPSVFDALPGYAREAAPDDLFKKQIRRGHLAAEKVLGAGEFGEVYLATQSNIQVAAGSKKTTSKKRAVKLLKAGAGKDDKEEFVRECQMMLKCDGHPNLVKLIGVAIQQAPWLCVLEYMEYGDLRTVLKAADEKGLELCAGEQVLLCSQLASACAWIAKARLIHMDLAARNVLLGADNRIKVADFGMTQAMPPGEDTLVLKGNVRLAIKWSAMESLMENTFSEKSDVWSTGIVFWEILNYGRFPYTGINNLDVLFFLISGDRMDRPPSCPVDFWEIIEQCWHEEADDRWSFSELHTRLERLITTTPRKTERDIGLYITNSKVKVSAKPKPKAGAAAGGGGGGGPRPVYTYQDKSGLAKAKAGAGAAAAAAGEEEDAYDVPIDVSGPPAEAKEEAQDENPYDEQIEIPAAPAAKAKTPPPPAPAAADADADADENAYDETIELNEATASRLSQVQEADEPLTALDGGGGGGGGGGMIMRQDSDVHTVSTRNSQALESEGQVYGFTDNLEKPKDRPKSVALAAAAAAEAAGGGDEGGGGSSGGGGADAGGGEPALEVPENVDDMEEGGAMRKRSLTNYGFGDDADDINPADADVGFADAGAGAGADVGADVGAAGVDTDVEEFGGFGRRGSVTSEGGEFGFGNEESE